MKEIHPVLAYCPVDGKTCFFTYNHSSSFFLPNSPHMSYKTTHSTTTDVKKGGGMTKDELVTKLADLGNITKKKGTRSCPFSRTPSASRSRRVRRPCSRESAPSPVLSKRRERGETREPARRSRYPQRRRRSSLYRQPLRAPSKKGAGRRLISPRGSRDKVRATRAGRVVAPAARISNQEAVPWHKAR